MPSLRMLFASLTFVGLVVAQAGPAGAVDMEVICAPSNDGDVPEVQVGEPLDVRVVFRNRRCPQSQPGFCADPLRTLRAGGEGSSGCRDIDPADCLIAWVDGGSGAASCFYGGGSCRGCGPRNESAGRCVNSCRLGDGGIGYNKLVVGLAGNGNDTLGGLRIFGPFKTGVSGSIPPADCEGDDDDGNAGVREETVRVLDEVPAKLAGTTAVVFAQVTVAEDGGPVGETESDREQEYCKVAIVARPGAPPDDDDDDDDDE